MREWIKIPVLLSLVYIVQSILISSYFKDLSFYILNSILWMIPILIIYFKGNISISELLNFRKDKFVVIFSVFFAIFHILSLILLGLFTVFGKNPHHSYFKGILINTIYLSIQIIVIEITKLYYYYNLPRSQIYKGIIFMCLFITFIKTPLLNYVFLMEPIKLLEFLGSNFIPYFTRNLLASGLLLLGGSYSSIVYLGILTAFEWLSPILPDPSWTLKAFLDILIPTIGFYVLIQTYNPFKLIRMGFISKSEYHSRKHSKTTFYQLLLPLVILICLWGSTGLLGFKPSVIGSGSMSPVLKEGDMAIAIPMRPESLRVGDIIQFASEGKMIIHRIIEKQQDNSALYFITKGDANDYADLYPIYSSQIVGKVMITIPKIGWVSIHIKSIIFYLVKYFDNITSIDIFMAFIVSIGIVIYAIKLKWSKIKQLYKVI